MTMNLARVSFSALSLTVLLGGCVPTEQVAGLTGAASSSGGTDASAADDNGGSSGGAVSISVDGGPAGNDGVAESGTSDGSGTSGAGTGETGSEVAPIILPPLVTSAQNAFWQIDGVLTEVATGTANVTVNDAAVAQTWDGFGGSFNELGWSYLTTPAMQTEALTLLFSAGDGANFAWGRIPMGASDYATNRYTLDDTGMDVTPNLNEANRPGPDLSLGMFSLARDGQVLIPYLKASQAVKPELRFWASPWTPPVWMKTGYKQDNGSGDEVVDPSYFDGGTMRNDPAILATYAQYFTNFVQGYEAQGIHIEVVSPQNEPGYDQNYPSCLWDQATYTTFIRQYLGPAMQPLGVTIMLGTMSNNGDNGRTDLNIANAVLADPAASSFLSVAGVQWNVLDSVNGGTTFGDLPIWATEHRCGNYPWNPQGYPPYNNVQAPNDQAYAVESWGYIRDSITQGGVTMYSAWNMVLDRVGLGNDTSRDWRQNTLLIAEGGAVTPTPTYYVFRHFSQYAAPGATVVGTTGGDAVAFKNPDGSLVAVMFNDGPANDNYVVSIGGKVLQFAMPGNGWATVKVTP